MSSDVLGLLLFNAGPDLRGLEPITREDGFRLWTFPADYDERSRELFRQVPGARAAVPEVGAARRQDLAGRTLAP